MSRQAKANEKERDTYFKALSGHQQLRQKLNNKKNTSIPTARSVVGLYSSASMAAPAVFSIRKSTHFKPSERFNTYAVNPQKSKIQNAVNSDLDYSGSAAQAGKVSGMGLPPLTSRSTSRKNYPQTEHGPIRRTPS